MINRLTVTKVDSTYLGCLTSNAQRICPVAGLERMTTGSVAKRLTPLRHKSIICFLCRCKISTIPLSLPLEITLHHPHPHPIIPFIIHHQAGVGDFVFCVQIENRCVPVGAELFGNGVRQGCPVKLNMKPLK